ncbi:hypothetical protein C8J56DRAFT_1037673 [Mycena floridula]|nr:hypothetical protein C8J56DRAFT_1037673 [Mycena floridula]
MNLKLNDKAVPLQPPTTLEEPAIKKRGRGASEAAIVPSSEVVDLTQTSVTCSPEITPPRPTKKNAVSGAWNYWIRKHSLGKGGINLPADELMTKLDTNVLFNIKFYPILK